LSFGGKIKTYWHSRNRYYKRPMGQLVKMVELYSSPTVGGALGHHGELLTLEGFAKKQFVLKGRHTAEYKDQKWTKTAHNLDMIVERDGLAYGVEVKNTLSYIEKNEFDTKIEICRTLGLKPVFAVRMLPKNWIWELLHKQDGFALIFKWQLYPYGHKTVADLVKKELGLPVDCPKSLYETTMTRFTDWHEEKL
jgi:hypothetical protein